MYAVYHGPEGLRDIAERVHRHARSIATSLHAAGHDVVHEAFFDTVLVRVAGQARDIVERAELAGINLRLVDANHVAIACDECTTDQVVAMVNAVFDGARTARPRSGSCRAPRFAPRPTCSTTCFTHTAPKPP